MAGTRVAILGAGIALLLALSACSAPSPAAPILSKIPGCTGNWTGSGSTLDGNTAAEGGCSLTDGTALKLYMWPSGDTTDQEDYIYQTAQNTSNGCSIQSDNSTGITLASGTDCIMGSTSAYLWFITFDVLGAPSYAASLAPPIESALNGQLVTNVPASWCTSGYCSPPASPSSAPQSPSPSTSPTPSPSPSPSAPPLPAPAPPAPGPTSASGAWCTATASVYNAKYNWNNVYVHSNQPYTSATASADGDSFGQTTNGSGYALIYLNGPPPGAEITVTVGGATCTTSD